MRPYLLVKKNSASLRKRLSSSLARCTRAEFLGDEYRPEVDKERGRDADHERGQADAQQV